MTINKKQLIELLQKRGVYDESDDILLNEFITNIKMMNKAKLDINKRGNLTACDKAGIILQQNPSIAIYNRCVKNLLDLSRKFGFTPRDRSELKIDGDEENIPL